jgi:hypothetical protein
MLLGNTLNQLPLCLIGWERPSGVIALLQAELAVLIYYHVAEKKSAPKARKARGAQASSASVLKAIISFDIIIAKLLFVAPSKHGVRLIVSKDGGTFGAYCFKDVLDASNAVIGDSVSLYVEKSANADNEEYWNVKAVSKI